MLKIKNQDLLKKYIKEYEEIPSSKKVLSTMIKYGKMYRPLHQRFLYPSLTIDIEGINELRELKRTQIYLNRKDIITTKDAKQGKKVIVTSRGHKIFYEDYPLAKLRKEPWDNSWTIVMYDFPEKERTRRRLLRRRLEKIGFGSPQISIMVTPLPLEKPVQQLVEGEGVNDKVWVLRAKRILGMTNKEVVQHAWPFLDEINTLYSELLENLPMIKSREDKKQWQKYFLAVNHADPQLPKELLPEDWQGFDCEREFLKTDPLRFIRSLFGG